ncbi:MAG: alpha/beta hydrolase [Glaciihabitans sp.]|nr:alpha/beta hydrolase [Glaciihabitans sp.]
MRRIVPRPPRLGRSLLAVGLAVLLPLVGGCAVSGAASDAVDNPSTELWANEVAYPDIEVIENVKYTTADDGTNLYLDVCLPTTADVAPEALKPRASIVMVHGGSWARGDKANVHYRNVCQWLASEGYVTVAVNYRLAPASIFPAAIEDVRDSVRWLRASAQVERFSLDPDRIGAFGGSAGANLVALLGTEGSGDLDTGSRVAAVAELSGPTDLTDRGRLLGGLTASFEQVQLDYLGCTSLAECPQARDASPLYDVDATDPPFFIGHSTAELIPLQQSEAFAKLLRKDGISAELVTVEGPLHSIAMLNDEMRGKIIDFYNTELTNEVPGVVP